MNVRLLLFYKWDRNYCDIAGGVNIWLGQPYFLVCVHDANTATAIIITDARTKWLNFNFICIKGKNYK